ncbi:MAG: tetratricopeptide repeat-containing serine protease family protein [Candidatus Acidiferrum sp.]
MDVFQKVSPSVFVVEALDENEKPLMLGSGVALANDFLITNCHVVQNGSSLTVSRGKEHWSARLIQAVPGHDLCGLRPTGLTLRPVEVRPSSKLATGERVYAIGSPEGLELTFSEGVISALRETEGVHMIQTSAPISPGSSGGGLFDAQGNLVGITSFQLKEGQSLNFALPGEWVAEASAKIAQADPKSSIRPNDAQMESTAWLEIGLDAMKKEDYDLAGHSLRKCADLKQPDAPRALLELGHLAEMATGLDSPSDAFESWLRKYDMTEARAQSIAIVDLEAALALKPAYADAWLELARVREVRKEYSQAISAAKEATRLEPGDWRAWMVLGGSYADAAFYPEAIEALHRAEKISPKQGDKVTSDVQEAVVLILLGEAYAGQGDREQVLRIYQELKNTNPTMAESFFLEYVLPQPNGHPSNRRSPQDRNLMRILRNASTTDEIRQAAWDAFHAAATREDFKQRFDAISLTNNVKAELWELKFGPKNSKSTPK